MRWIFLAGALFYGVIVAGCGRGVSTEALRFRELATQKLGEHLAQRYAGAKLLVLSNPFTQEKGRPAEIYAFEEAGLKGLRKGLGKELKLQAVAFPELRPESRLDPQSVYVDPKTTTPLSYHVTEGSIDELMLKYPATDLIVSLIGLPVQLDNVQSWSRAGKPSFALLLPDLRFVGDNTAIKSAFQSGKIAAAVMDKPLAPADGSGSATDPQAEFDQQFLLVTSENMETLLRAYPRLFGSESGPN